MKMRTQQAEAPMGNPIRLKGKADCVCACVCVFTAASYALFRRGEVVNSSSTDENPADIGFAG